MILGTSDLALDHGDAKLLGQLVRVWQEKSPRNLIRSIYFEGKNAFRDFGIAIPPQLVQNGFTPLQWIEKGVHAMTDRSVFEGFVSPDGGEDAYGLEGLLAANNFADEFPEAQVSAAVHACSFLTVSHGDTAAGEPDVLMLARSADSSAALWDRRRRAMSGFLSIVDTDDQGTPSVLVMHTPEKVVTLTRFDGKWLVEARRNPLGEVSVAHLTFRPELNRPFGHSRITRSAMALTDAALRTIMRAEVSAEFYSTPDYWLFGADASAFTGSNKWKALVGRIKAIERDEDGEVPEIHRFAGASPQPHTEQLRMLATLFAGDQGLAVSSLGVVQDNPSSAEAIYAAKEDLIIETGGFNRSTGRGAVKAAQLAVRLRDGLDFVPPELQRLSAMFTDPAMTSPTAKADAFSKRAAVIEGFASSEVGLESAGLTREQVLRFNEERRKGQASSRLDALAASGAQQQAAAVSDPQVSESLQASEESAADAAALKAKFDALGVAIRSGVDPMSAAEILGLPQLRFTGATPVSLRLKETDAAALEEK